LDEIKENDKEGRKRTTIHEEKIEHNRKEEPKTYLTQN